MKSRRSRQNQKGARSRPKSKTVSFPFLQLPSELRNKIYEFALSCDHDDLQYRHWTNKLNRKPIFYAKQRTTKDVQEFNQIKYVCRQMYAETAGLELKYNSLTFTKMAKWETEAVYQFLNFSSACTKRLDWLRTVTLTTNRETCRSRYSFCDIIADRLPSIIKLGGFCLAHPHISVNFVIPHFRIYDKFYDKFYEDPRLRFSHPLFFIAAGIFLNFLLREKDVSFLLPHLRSDYYSMKATSSRGGKSVQRFQADNLRFWPEMRKFDEQFFREYAQKRSNTWRAFGRRLDVLVEHVRDWIENGI